MGYFPNGTAGEMYEAQYCSRCIHDGDCAVMLAHLMHNYAECNKPKSILHLLIPITKDGLDNEQCKMFVEGKPPEPPEWSEDAERRFQSGRVDGQGAKS